jgi:flagellar hook assembly protein FlgD
VHGNESPYAALVPDQVVGVGEQGAPMTTYVEQNTPNPFNPTTTIRFGLKEPARVQLTIYDAAGRLVRQLIDDSRPARHYTVTWDGRDRAGQSVASGVYFCRLTAGSFKETKKMVLIR